jgi:hypothetical protein
VIGPFAGRTYRRAGGVEAFEDRGRAERGIDVAYRALELELALLDELHGRDVAMAFVIEAMRKTVSGVMTQSSPSARRAEGALVERRPLSVAAIATTPGTSLASTACFSRPSMRAPTADLGVSPAGRRGMVHRGSGGDGSGSLQYGRGG